MLSTRKFFLIFSLCSLVLAGCGTTPNGNSGAPVAGPSGGEVITVDSGDVQTGEPPPELTDPNSPLSKRDIYFALDQYVVTPEYQALVKAHGDFLRGHRQLKVLIQGNTDERGSHEYNLSLGQKRAEAVRRQLLLLGADEAQVEAVSLGEEKPRREGHNEEAWAENRRAEILYGFVDGRKGEF